MARYHIYRNLGNTYNPYWLTLVRKTKTGADLKVWITLIFAWKASTKDDLEPWIRIEKNWRKRRPNAKELERITKNWKLTFNSIIGTGRGLARSEKQLFDKIKRGLRSGGEGKTCWACGALPRRGEVGLDAHEFWDFDFKRRIRILKAVHFLCTDCHYLVHRGDVMFLPIPTEDVIRLAELFCRVNSCKLIEAYRYLNSRGFDGNPNDTANWKIDLSLCDMPLP